jgi:hypothetical protein
MNYDDLSRISAIMRTGIILSCEIGWRIRNLNLIPPIFYLSPLLLKEYKSAINEDNGQSMECRVLKSLICLSTRT